MFNFGLIMSAGSVAWCGPVTKMVLCQAEKEKNQKWKTHPHKKRQSKFKALHIVHSEFFIAFKLEMGMMETASLSFVDFDKVLMTFLYNCFLMNN